MFRSISLPALLVLCLFRVNGQGLKMLPEIERAYQNGTRDFSGKPGIKYWQNGGHYNISVSLSPPGNVINGVEQITYFNNSPYKLDSLNIKLIENVYRGKHWSNADAGIIVDDIKINGTKAGWDNSKAITTNYMVGLPKALMPQDSVKLNFIWHYKLTKEKGRDGIIEPTTFYLAYFYPRIAVLDDYNGWDTQQHTGELEFYNDFNDYTLNVTVPKNYIVWATGDLRNPDQVLQPGFAKKLKNSLTCDTTIHVVTVQDIVNKNVTAQNATNTWIFTSNNITDVALGVSNTYVWDAASVVVDDLSHRRVSLQAAFADASKDFHRSVQNSHYALGWFSHNWPGVPYPFSKSTAFQGFADMEYPMMVNDSHQTDLAFAELVQDHEQAHTYFPFYMGINESYWAFMDEGWATTLEYLIGIEKKGKKYADKFYKDFRINRWIHGSHVEETAIVMPSPYVKFGAGNNAYGKPSLSYLALKDYLGDDLFKKALHQYMDNWHGKHPMPWDYFYSMSTGSGKDLNWFFNNWFFTPSYIDLKLEDVNVSPRAFKLNIKNIGGFAIPFDVVLIYSDETTETLHQTPAVWEKDQKNISISVRGSKKVKSIILDTGIFMDADESDNKWNNN